MADPKHECDTIDYGADEIPCQTLHTDPLEEDWQNAWDGLPGPGGKPADRELTLKVDSCEDCKIWIRYDLAHPIKDKDGREEQTRKSVKVLGKSITTPCVTMVQVACVGGTHECKCKWKIVKIEKC